MAKKPDCILLGTTIALIVLGILILASVSAPLSQEKFGTTYYFLNHQLLFGLLPGLILAFLAFRIPLGSLKKWAPALLLINLGLVAMVFLPSANFLVGGISAGGATRWLSLGFFAFQPAEFLKLTFILYLASWLAVRTSGQHNDGEKIQKGFNTTLTAFLIIIIVIGLLLVLQPDISTLGIIIITATIMYFLANTPSWHSIFIILAGAGSLLALIKLAPYRLARLLVFLGPGTDPMGIGYQIKQALIVIGSGGIFGLGLGMSQQEFGFLPQTISDSIFALFAQEGGFIGSSVLILLFLLFFWRGFRIGKLSQNKFSQLTGLGITSWICLQASLNIGSMVGILPLSGTPLPFISYGGSSLVTELIGVGILLNISKNVT